jgi:hypothetical protein
MQKIMLNKIELNLSRGEKENDDLFLANASQPNTPNAGWGGG